MESNQESNDAQSGNEKPTAKQWLQDNLRIIVSIFIVVVIATGIYSYSNRSGENGGKEKQAEQNDALSNELAQNEGDISQAENDTQKDKKITSQTTSQETESSFIETAGKGDSLTKLARKSLADYLEKKTDSSLTPEQKIYIEDYLRKSVTHKGGVQIGTSVEFSKSLIENAIAKSKNLNERQIKNLHKYTLRVPSLS